jgi:glycolate oxidase iron-sulfur subunit
MEQRREMIAKLSSVAQAHEGLRVSNDSMIAMPLEKPQHRIAVLADQCVQCGLCLPVCPTYGLDGNEAESPRGRIALAAALARGQVSVTPALRKPIDHCVGCLNCQRVCPAGVQYEELLIETRGLLGPAPDRPSALLEVVKRPKLNRWLQRLAQWTAATRWVPAMFAGKTASSWRAALSMLPRRSSSSSTKPVSPRPADLGVVALFPGCAASVQDADAEHAAESLLRAVGYRVIRLPAFCCGALDLHDGATADADKAAEQVRRAWGTAKADHLITVTPGCLTTLRRALPGTRVDDPYALLAEHLDRLAFRPLALRVALHVPCTQANVARSDAALVRLLKRIPDLELKRMTTPPYCCGAAGSHALQFPDRADRLRDDVIAHIHTLDAQLVLSSNIGCRLHLAAGLAEHASTLPTLHPLTLLAQQLDNR